jgi:hypothetical protein
VNALALLLVALLVESASVVIVLRARARRLRLITKLRRENGELREDREELLTRLDQLLADQDRWHRNLPTPLHLVPDGPIPDDTDAPEPMNWSKW